MIDDILVVTVVVNVVLSSLLICRLVRDSMYHVTRPLTLWHPLLPYG